MYIGIDLGGTNIAVAVVDDDCRIICQDKVKTRAGRPAEEIVADMAALARSVADASVGSDAIEWVGVGCPGTIDRNAGKVVYANNLPFLRLPLAEMFRKHYDKPVYLENDANAAALGEMYAGEAKGCRDVIFITLGTGIGGGIIIDGKLYRGFNGAGGELGHIGIVAGGRPCTCGNSGCWEAYASATALTAFTKEAMLAHPESAMWSLTDGDIAKAGGRTAFQAMRAGDAAGKAVAEKYTYYLAYGMVSLINIFQPEIICVGGGVCNEGPALLDPMIEFVKANIYTRDVPQTQIRAAALGNAAGIIGAAMLGKQL